MVLGMVLVVGLLGSPTSLASPPPDAETESLATSEPAATEAKDTAEPPPASSSDTRSSPASDPPRAGSLADNLTPWFAFVIGAIGSFTYLMAVAVGFVAKDPSARERILAGFRGESHPQTLAKWVTYVVCGGFVAMIFQLPETKLVAIQAFIIGCTWPAVVSNYLSGAQTTGLGVREQILELREMTSALEAERTDKAVLVQDQATAGAAAPSDEGLEAGAPTPPDLDALLRELVALSSPPPAPSPPRSEPSE